MPASDSIENVIPLRDYYRRVNFGFAAGQLDLASEQLDECADRKNFDALELPYEQFEAMSESARKRLNQRYRMIHCGNLLPKSLTSMVPDAGLHIRTEFIRTCGMIFRHLAESGIACGSLDFSLDGVLADPERMKSLSRLLNKLHPSLMESRVTLLLPVRLPFASDEMSEQIALFLRHQMMPNLKLRLDIYPHEMKPNFDPVKLAGCLRLETRSVLFCCNADSGNRLIRAQLAPWLRYFALTGFPGPYLFSPFSLENRLAAVESEACSMLTAELRAAQK